MHTQKNAQAAPRVGNPQRPIRTIAGHVLRSTSIDHPSEAEQNRASASYVQTAAYWDKLHSSGDSNSPPSRFHCFLDRRFLTLARFVSLKPTRPIHHARMDVSLSLALALDPSLIFKTQGFSCDP